MGRLYRVRYYNPKLDVYLCAPLEYRLAAKRGGLRHRYATENELLAKLKKQQLNENGLMAVIETLYIHTRFRREWKK